MEPRNNAALGSHLPKTAAPLPVQAIFCMAAPIKHHIYMCTRAKCPCLSTFLILHLVLSFRAPTTNCQKTETTNPWAKIKGMWFWFLQNYWKKRETGERRGINHIGIYLILRRRIQNYLEILCHTARPPSRARVFQYFMGKTNTVSHTTHGLYAAAALRLLSCGRDVVNRYGLG